VRVVDIMGSIMELSAVFQGVFIFLNKKLSCTSVPNRVDSNLRAAKPKGELVSRGPSSVSFAIACFGNLVRCPELVLR
jgi:hypothetical protein